MIKNNTVANWAQLLTPIISILVLAVFETVYHNNSYVQQTIIIKSVLVTWLGYAIIRVGVEEFKNRFYAAMFFIIFVVLYLAVFPAIAVIIDAHFVIRDHEIFGYQKVLNSTALSIILFALTYYFSLSKQKKNVTLIAISHEGHRQVIYAAILLCIGLFSIAWLSVSLNTMDVETYDEVSQAFSGKGWLLRLAEMTAIAGVIFLCAGNDNQRKYLYFGIACVVMFSLFRLQFLNRENVIKYYFVVLIYFIYIREKALSPKQIQLLFIVIFLLLALIPNLSIMRAAINKKAQNIDYAYTFARDLNFSEVAAVIYANDDFKGAMGFREGWYRTYTQMIPRGLFENKPLTVSAVITARTTNAPGYDELNPTFIYAASFLGVYYYISGMWLVMLYVILSAFFAAKLTNWSNNATSQLDQKLRKAFMAVYIYHIVIATIKLDPGNAFPAAVLSCLASYIACIKIKQRR